MAWLSFIELDKGVDLENCMQVRKGGSEEIPLIQGKEQRLRFAGAAVKRFPTSR